MDDFIKAVQAKDFVKVKRIFTEQMEKNMAIVVENRKIEIAKNVMIEGESPIDDDEDDDDEDDSDEDDEKSGKKED